MFWAHARLLAASVNRPVGRPTLPRSVRSEGNVAAARPVWWAPRRGSKSTRKRTAGRLRRTPNWLDRWPPGHLLTLASASERVFHVRRTLDSGGTRGRPQNPQDDTVALGTARAQTGFVAGRVKRYCLATILKWQAAEPLGKGQPGHPRPTRRAGRPKNTDRGSNPAGARDGV